MEAKRTKRAKRALRLGSKTLLLLLLLLFLSFLLLPSAGYCHVFCQTTSTQSKPLPQFKDYPAQETFSGIAAKPKLTSKRARLFRTVIRTPAAEGPNFAGHYRIATWGCGAGCVQFAIVDLQTGDVYFPPEVETVMVLLEQEDDPLQFQAKSRLLGIAGHKEKANFRDSGEGRFFYEWKNNRLVLLRSVKL
jgi:hypothetical protein